MSLLLIAPKKNMNALKDALLEIDKHLDIEVWPTVKNKDRVTFAVSWKHPDGIFEGYPNLQAIMSYGAGVDHMLQDKALPDVFLSRVVAPSLSDQLADYVLTSVLNYQQHIIQYADDRKDGEWEPHTPHLKSDFSVGIMGLGQIGQNVAKRLTENGYQVNGWSTSKKDLEHIVEFVGPSELEDFLSKTNVLVCLLPLTPHTEGILDLDLFKKLKQPAYLINAARGAHLVEEDLIYALDRDLIEGATLDVFSQEPLPDSHPFWNRPRIMITPHIAALTHPKEVAPQIVENYKRSLSGIELLNQVDIQRGY